MAYPTLPPTLTALAGALATPGDTELAAVWPAVDRQTRNWLYDFLTTYFDPTTNQLKPAAIGGGTVPTGSVSGSNPQTGAQLQILQGSIQTLDLAPAIVTTAKIANLAITTALIANGAVGTAQLADGCVTSAKLAAASIPGTAIVPSSIPAAAYGANSVGTAALVDASITNSKVAVRAVDGSQLPALSAGQILVGGGTVGGQANSPVAATLSGAATIDANGVLTLVGGLIGTILSYARVCEVGKPGITCGKSNSATTFGGELTSSTGYLATYTPWNGRGLGQGASTEANVAWSKVLDPANILTVNDTILKTYLTIGSTNYATYQHPIYVNQQCTLLILASVPGYEVGTHRMRLVTMADPTQPQNFQQYWGTSETSGSSSAVQTRSQIAVLVQFAGPAGSALPYFYIDWFANATDAAGMGLESGLGGNEYYGDISVIRLA